MPITCVNFEHLAKATQPIDLRFFGKLAGIVLILHDFIYDYINENA